MVISAALFGDCHASLAITGTANDGCCNKNQFLFTFHSSLLTRPTWGVFTRAGGKNLDVYSVAFKLADGFFHIATVKNRFATYHNVNAKPS